MFLFVCVSELVSDCVCMCESVYMIVCVCVCECVYVVFMCVCVYLCVCVCMCFCVCEAQFLCATVFFGTENFNKLLYGLKFTQFRMDCCII